MTRNLSSIPSRLLLLITCFFAQSTLAYGDALPQLSISDVTVSESVAAARWQPSPCPSAHPSAGMSPFSSRVLMEPPMLAPITPPSAGT